MDPARPAQLDKLWVRTEDHASSFVDQEKEESVIPSAMHAQHTPNFHLMEKLVNLAQSDGLLLHQECAHNAQMVSWPLTKEPARKTFSANHTPDSQLMVWPVLPAHSTWLLWPTVPANHAVQECKLLTKEFAHQFHARHLKSRSMANVYAQTSQWDKEMVNADNHSATIDKFSWRMDLAKTAHFTLCQIMPREPVLNQPAHKPPSAVLMLPAHHADGTCNQTLPKETVFQLNIPPLLHNPSNKWFNKLFNQSLQPAPGATVDSEMKYSSQIQVHSNSINHLPNIHNNNMYTHTEEVLALPMTKPASLLVSTEYYYNF